MRVMGVAVVVMAVVVAGKRHVAHVMLVHMRALFDVLGRRFASFGMRSNTVHRDGRKRLSRKAQRQQHDNEEFAPVRHGSGV